MKRTVLALALMASTQAGASFYCVQVQYSPNRQDTRFDQISWTANVWMPVPEMPGVIIDSWTVEFACAASGAELDYIRARFTGIPMRMNASGGPASRTVVWSGDDARFILDNL